MLNVSTVTSCVGCGLCESLCPRNAITMKLNADGFLRPHIDASQCADCGMCLNQCIVADRDTPKSGHQDVCKAFGAWNTDRSITLKSSSGGVFSAIASHVVSHGGVVFGVRWRENELKAEFSSVAAERDIELLRGSKYVPAFTCEVYKKVKAELKKGKLVFFVGTPCQVHALNAYLKRREYDNLITADIVCHGIPSYNLFKKYLEEYERDTGCALREIAFRDKKWGWADYSMRRTDARKNTTYIEHKTDDYMRMFLGDKALNESCYNCNFITDGRQGDISMGDFWGVQKYHPEWPVRDGISVVLGNSEKGKLLLEKLNGDSLSMHSMPYHAVRRFAGRTIYFSPRTNERLVPRERPEVLSLLRDPDISLSKIVSRYCGARKLAVITPNPRNVAVLGLWYSLNYGAVMTSYALCRIIESLGYKPTLVDKAGSELTQDPTTVFRQFFRDRAVSVTEHLNGKKRYFELNNSFSTFVVGSDQLWRYKYTGGQDWFFFLDFCKAGKKRIAFGTSIGTNPCEAPDAYRERSAELLKFFTGVSTREQDGLEVLANQYHTKAEFVMDPVFVCDQSCWDECIKASKATRPEGDFVFSYVLDPAEEVYRIMDHVCKREDAGNVFIPHALSAYRGENYGGRFVEATPPHPDDWLFFMKHCTHVVTDSFHGMCFAIIFHKPFTVIANRRRGYSRFVSLLNTLNLSEYLVDGEADIERLEKLPPIDWSTVDAVIAKLRNHSIEWLANCLSKPLDDSTLSEQLKFQLQYEVKIQADVLEKKELFHYETLCKRVDQSEKSAQASLEKVDNQLEMLAKKGLYRFNILSKRAHENENKVQTALSMHDKQLASLAKTASNQYETLIRRADARETKVQSVLNMHDKQLGMLAKKNAFHFKVLSSQADEGTRKVNARLDKLANQLDLVARRDIHRTETLRKQTGTRIANIAERLKELNNTISIERHKREDETYNLALILQYKYLRNRYYFYRIIEKITLGNKRRRNKEKKRFYKNLYSRAKAAMRGVEILACFHNQAGAKGNQTPVCKKGKVMKLF